MEGLRFTALLLCLLLVTVAYKMGTKRENTYIISRGKFSIEVDYCEIKNGVMYVEYSKRQRSSLMGCNTCKCTEIKRED